MMDFDVWDVIRGDENQPRQGITDVERIFEITVETPSIAAGQPYWKVIGLHHFSEQAAGLHHVYLDVIEDGERIDNAILIGRKGDLPEFQVIINKPHNEPGTNIPMWSQDRVRVFVHWPTDNPLPSEVVSNLHTQHDPVEGEGWRGHHSFYVIFKKMIAGDENDLDTDPENSLVQKLFAVGEPLIIPLNREAELYQVSQEHNLGERLTREYIVDFNGQKYTSQIYEKGLVYAPTGNWENIRVITQ